MKAAKVLVFLGCLLFGIAIVGSMAIEPPEEIEMKDSLGKTKNPLYTPVIMPHKKHEKIPCETCHHKWTDKTKAPLKCTSSGCHDLINAKGPQMMNKKSAYFAFHDKKSVHSCLSCHAKNKVKNKPTGPLSCKGCHKK